MPSDETTAPPASTETEPATRLRGWRVTLPAAAFLGGFVWDALTLGRAIRPVDLLILCGYFLGAATILVLMGRRVEFRGSSKLNLVLQFLFGGMFSALVVLYFLSSSAAKSFVVVAGLAVMLVTNEFLGEAYDRLSLSWAVFGACGVMLLNFVLPTAMRSIHPAWFYVSLACACGVVFLLRRISHDDDAVIWPTLAVAAVLGLLHVLNVIPPVPLASRAMVVGSEVAREGDAFVVTGRISRALTPWRPRTLVHEAGSPVYCFTSVFVPRGIRTSITHRWMMKDPRSGEWKTTDAIRFEIAGGREGGYRGFTRKRNVPDGEWMVVAETETGNAIASTRFRVSSEAGRRARAFVRQY